jgi:hypothetical protein
MNGVLPALLQAAAPGGPALVDGFLPSPSRSSAAFVFRPAAS